MKNALNSYLMLKVFTNIHKLIGLGIVLGTDLFMPTWVYALPEDSQQPIHIVSNSAMKDNKIGLTVYQGNVDITQGTLNIRADKVTIYSNQEQVVKIIAVGSPARFKQKPAADKADVLAKAKTIEYTLDSKLISLTSDASLDQDGSKITGNTIVYDVNAARVEANSNNDSGPVTVVIPPQPKAEQ